MESSWKQMDGAGDSSRNSQSTSQLSEEQCQTLRNMKSEKGLTAKKKEQEDQKKADDTAAAAAAAKKKEQEDQKTADDAAAAEKKKEQEDQKKATIFPSKDKIYCVFFSFDAISATFRVC